MPIACIGSVAHVSLWEVRSWEEHRAWALGRWAGSVLGNDAVIVATVLADLRMHPTCYLLNPTNVDVRHVAERVGPHNVVAVDEEPGELTRSLCLEDHTGRRTWVFSRVPKSPADLGRVRESFVYADYYTEFIGVLNSNLYRLSGSSDRLVLNVSAVLDLNANIRLPFRPTVLQASVGTAVSIDDATAYATRLVTSTEAQRVFVTMGSRGAVLATSNGCWHSVPHTQMSESVLGAGAIFSSQVIRGLVDDLDGEVLLQRSVECTAEYLERWVMNECDRH